MMLQVRRFLMRHRRHRRKAAIAFAALILYIWFSWAVSELPPDGAEFDDRRAAAFRRDYDEAEMEACVMRHTEQHFTARRDPEKAFRASNVADATAMQRRLVAHQLCSPCERTIFMSEENTGSGIGSRFTTMHAALYLALYSNRKLVLGHGHWLYTDSEKCPFAGHDCYFTSVSSCPDQAEPLFRWRWDNRLVNSLRTTKVDFGVDLKMKGHWLPEWAESRGRGTLWFQSQLMYFLLQPRPEVRAAVDAARAKMPSWGHPIIAMHVRHGDKGTETKTFPFEDYMKVAEEFRQKYNVERILVSTEDRGVVEATKDYPQFTFMWTDYPRLNKDIRASIRGGELNGEGEAMNALTNLYLAVDCDFFIGTFSSGWGRLVLKMMYATYGYVPPHHSLDPWSWDPTGEPDATELRFND